ncbi:monocarboxylate transporter 10 isoform X2 [Microplitis mediator]|uniref:monocarboxylate transporter 10 isoform X2 n=1 Tax=Microplitis mediator TaxID=375433 RepID=UPI0025564A30|nr:monocarboxylate transporter 10 isoform X2 [Microplitis mediator]
MTVTDYNEPNADLDSTMALDDTKRSAVTGVTNNKDESDKFNSNHDQEERNPFIEQQSVGFLTDEYKSKNYFSSQNNSRLKDAAFKEDKVSANQNNPPDGGIRAWMILLGSFIINGVLFSIINSYSLMQVQLTEKLKDLGVTSAEAKASLVGSLTIGTTFFLSPIAGILTDKIGIQLTTFIGGLLAFAGMLLSSIYCEDVVILCLTYGIMYGTGASLAYTPSLVILGHYFKRRLGLANGIVTAGSSVFTSIMPYVMSALLDSFGMVGAFRSLAVLTLIIMLCAVLFKPISIKEKSSVKDKSSYQDPKSKKATINLSIWKKKRYVVWASAIPLALFGYFVPYVYIGSFVIKSFGKEFNTKVPVMCIGITSGVGRLVFGYVADLPRINRILLQQISFISIGILTMLLPLTPPYYSALVVISLGFGLFDGCFISLLGPIAFDICGKSGATQAIGFLLGICSIPLTAGPPIGGLLMDYTGSYTLTFVLAGIPPIIGAIVMFAINCVKEDKVEDPDKLEDGSINADCCLDGIAKKGFGSISRLSGGSVQLEED